MEKRKDKLQLGRLVLLAMPVDPLVKLFRGIAYQQLTTNSDPSTENCDSTHDSTFSQRSS